jgi:hypothetical protein
MKRLIFIFFLFLAIAANSQTCAVAGASSVSSNSGTSVTVSFVLNVANVGAMQVYYVKTGNTDTANVLPFYGTSVTINGLTVNTNYSYFIRTYCNNGSSANTNIRTFTTFPPALPYTAMAASGYSYKRVSVDTTFHLPLQDTFLNRGITRAGAVVIRPQDGKFYGWDGAKWGALGGLSAEQISDSLKNFVRLQTLPPTASLTGGFSYERSSATSGIATINWGAGRQAATGAAAATTNIASIVVGGVTPTFTQPAAGASVSGTQAVTFPINANTTFTNTVTTTDAKTASASTSFTVYDKRYIGWSVTPTPTDAEIRAAIAQDNNGGSGNYSANLPQLGTARYLFYANTVTTSSVVLNGFPSTAAFTLNQSRTFTNSVGGQTTYFVTVINAPTGNVGATSVTFN